MAADVRFQVLCLPNVPWEELRARVVRLEAMAGRILELGMDELVLYYPPDASQLPVFERVATDVLPRLRASRAGGGRRVS